MVYFDCLPLHWKPNGGILFDFRAIDLSVGYPPTTEDAIFFAECELGVHKRKK